MCDCECVLCCEDVILWQWFTPSWLSHLTLTMLLTAQGPVSWQALAILRTAGGVDDKAVLRHVAFKELSGLSVRRVAAIHAARITAGDLEHSGDPRRTDAGQEAGAAVPVPLPDGLEEREVAFWTDKKTPCCTCGLPTCIVQATSKEQGGRFITKCLIRYKVRYARHGWEHASELFRCQF